ncbi:helix-turn-helix domain-containing protein [Lutibacter sp. A80]|uniref:helix-turn-helix domain-containing protein n=1 Tax=Lutibacter sp. A80 TaxID=2918453 RepID=UPI001F060A36|nr:helix-turn-helix domain-containing protein [Lutibacter sp. A80]UMB59505.1 helix-turn-helix domain-containing protein [Lutibacter sp. A80]
MIYTGKTNEYLRIELIDANNCTILKENIESSLTLLWCLDNTTTLTIDNKKHHFKKNEIVCFTEFHKIETTAVGKLQMIRFNRPFYCIIDHDSEISCKGILFFGASQLPVLKLLNKDIEPFETLFKVFKHEMESNDKLQLEMLQMLLKRLLILCTRIYKDQHNYNKLDSTNSDIVREYNFLVETHFKTKHTVSEYAEILNKSPKTLSNLFSKLETKTPLQFIQDRIMLETRRLLRYTDSSIKEIAYQVGYEDIQSFSRFFKKNEGISPSEYKKMSL